MAVSLSPDGTQIKEISDWKKWCRLCAKNDPLSNVNVFWKNEQNVPDTSLSTAIGKYFWVNIKNEETNSTHICLECHQLVSSLITFTERVNRVQTMFSVLQNMNSNNSFDPDDIRMQFNILDEERHHIISHKNDIITEMHINVIDSDNIHVQGEEQVETEEIDDQVEYELDEVPQEQQDYVMHMDGHEVPEAADTTEVAQVDNVNYIHRGEMTTIHHVVKSIKKEKAEGQDDNGMKIEEECNEVVVSGENQEQGIYVTDEDKSMDDIDDCDLFKVLKFKSGNERNQVAANNQKPQKDETYRRKRGRPIKFHDSSSADMEFEFTKKSKSNGSNEATPFKYECKVCERKYKNPTSYRKHLTETHQIEPDIPDFVCEKCNKVLPTEKQLAVHLRSHMSLEEKMDIPCLYCDKKFTKIAVMRQHVRGIHHNEKPYICDECGRGLKTLAALNEHKLVHTNETPCICGICKKGFKNNARLKVHLDTHPETNYICNICGMVLNTRRTLKMHMLVHSDNRRYKCDYCGSEFKRSKALKNHLILHTGMRPYKCNFCQKTFSNGSNCRSHKKKAHPIELAEEEAQGKKQAPITVPKLEELRSGTAVIDKPIKIKRPAIHTYLRTLLLANETKQEDGDIVEEEEEDGEEEFEEGEEFESTEIHTRILSDIDIQNCEIELEDGIEDDDEIEEGDEEETVIYEIIDEI